MCQVLGLNNKKEGRNPYSIHWCLQIQRRAREGAGEGLPGRQGQQPMWSPSRRECSADAEAQETKALQRHQHRAPAQAPAQSSLLTWTGAILTGGRNRSLAGADQKEHSQDAEGCPAHSGSRREDGVRNSLLFR